MTDRRDNQPPAEGWELPPRCCGEWADDVHCRVCGNLPPVIPPNIELGCE